jgi:hypothetical protein
MCDCSASEQTGDVVGAELAPDPYVCIFAEHQDSSTNRLLVFEDKSADSQGPDFGIIFDYANNKEKTA